MRKTISLAILLCAIMLVSCSPAEPSAEELTKNAIEQSESKVSTDPIKIGFIMPFSGEAGVFGQELKLATDLAIEEVNAGDGIRGRALEVIYEDGACDPKDATNAAQKLINIDGVKVIIGGLCSGETLAAAPIAEENEIILFSPGSGSPDITPAGDYIFRNFPSDATSGNKVATYAYEKGDEKFAILAEQNDYSFALKEVFKKTLEEQGGEVVLDEAFTPSDTDFKTQLIKIKESDATGIYVVTTAMAQYGIILKQLNELEIGVNLYTNELASSPDVLSDFAVEIEGAVFAEPFFDAESDLAAPMIAKVTELNDGEAPGALPPVYLATAYDSVHIISEVLEVCGEDTSCIKDELYAVEGRAGTAGTLSIDENGDPEFEYILKTVQNGEVSIIS